jgi:hypothetical protein
MVEMLDRRGLEGLESEVEAVGRFYGAGVELTLVGPEEAADMGRRVEGGSGGDGRPLGSGSWAF